MIRTRLAALAALALLLAACTGSGSAQFQNVGGDLDADGGALTAPSAAAGDEAPGDAEGFAAPVEQRIIKTGELSLEVEDVGAALAEVRSLAEQVGGYVGGSQAGTVEQTATITLRIPADRFEDALARLRELDGTVLGESTREEDVTAQVVDLEARIDNLTASEASYRALVERATAVDDVLAVQSRLDQVRGQIEQLQAQLDNVSGQAALSTLIVRLVPAAAPVEAQAAGWDPGAQFDRATAALIGIGQAIVNVAIWLGIVILPVALALAILGWLALRLVPLARRRSAPSVERVEP